MNIRYLLLILALTAASQDSHSVVPPTAQECIDALPRINAYFSNKVYWSPVEDNKSSAFIFPQNSKVGSGSLAIGWNGLKHLPPASFLNPRLTFVKIATKTTGCVYKINNKFVRENSSDDTFTTNMNPW